MNRNERLLRLIVLLRRAKHPMSRAALFARHSAYGEGGAKRDSQLRMFERDKLALRNMGLDIEVVGEGSGEELGYRLPPGPAPSLRCSKRQRLLLAAAADNLAHVPGMPLRAAALNALAKLMEQPVGEPVAQRADARLEKILERLEQGQSLNFQYKGRRSNRSRQVVIDDVIVELRASAWYLTGFDRRRAADRSFRIDRIVGAVKGVTPGPGRRSEAPWSPWHIAAEPALEVTMTAGPAAAPLPQDLKLLSSEGERVVVQTRNSIALKRWLCSGVGWRVEAPDRFKKELVNALAGLEK